MKLIQKNENQITFQAEVEESLANVIRRYVYQIPVLAVDEVEMIMNDSPLYDETLAHRIGLLPLVTGKSVNFNSKGELKLHSKKEGMVYSGELTGDVKLVYDNMPLTILDEGQELKLVATIKAGRGSEHSKFVAGLMFYRNIVEIKIDKDCPIEAAEVCSNHSLVLKDGKVVVANSDTCDICDACTEECKKKGKDSIKITPTKDLMITIESFGPMNYEDIFNKSIDVLKKDLAEISKVLK